MAEKMNMVLQVKRKALLGFYVCTIVHLNVPKSLMSNVKIKIHDCTGLLVVRSSKDNKDES